MFFTAKYAGLEIEKINEYNQIKFKNVVKGILFFNCDDQEFKSIKLILKIPMVSIVLISALLGAIDCSFLKGVTLLLQMPSDIFHCTSTYVYMVITTVTSNLQLFFINMAMKFYDQSKIGPVNVASLILLNLFCGCIILDE